MIVGVHQANMTMVAIKIIVVTNSSRDVPAVTGGGSGAVAAA